MSTSINNKEYLKKYLSLGKAPGEKRKKKKKPKGVSAGLKIVDDDVSVSISEEIRQDLEGDTEDAPQIVSVIDDRPPSLRVEDDSRIKLWKPIGSVDDAENNEKTIRLESGFRLDQLQKQTKISKAAFKNLSSKKKVLKSQDSDFSPPRAKIKVERRSPSLDNSPPRLKHRDNSPPRKIKEEVLSQSDEEDNAPPRSRDRNKDITPVRKRIKNEYHSFSQKEDGDISPPRKSRRDKSEDISSIRKNSRDNSRSEDISPPRRRNRDITSPRKKDRDISPPRKNDRDISPPRKRNKDISPSRTKKSRWGSESEKMTKTLEGKTAGLQNAIDLAKETAEMKRKNDEIFKNMSAESSGRNAATVVRNPIRNKHKQVDPEEEERKRIKDEQNKEKYDKWGKGLKQVEVQNARIADMAHEMNKPLARYADDQDLEDYLKEQDREGDPMLAYIKKKKKKAHVEAGGSIKPQYQGEFPSNRFGIPPGYRWDGVNRSNGYEKKFFEVQNKRRADMEEAYKWSTEDM